MGGRYIKSQYYYYSNKIFYRAQNSHSVRFAYAVMLTICIITGKLDNQKFGNLLITTLILPSDAGTVNKQFHFNHSRITPVHESVLAHNSQHYRCAHVRCYLCNPNSVQSIHVPLAGSPRLIMSSPLSAGRPSHVISWWRRHRHSADVSNPLSYSTPSAHG